jgi:hypothetical protein
MISTDLPSQGTSSATLFTLKNAEVTTCLTCSDIKNPCDLLTRCIHGFHTNPRIVTDYLPTQLSMLRLVMDVEVASEMNS